MLLAQKKKENKKAVVNLSPWKKVEAYENYKSHSEFVFKPNFQTDVLTDLNSDSKPINCFFTSFIDEIQDILIIYINHYAQNKCSNNNGGNKSVFPLVYVILKQVTHKFF